MDRSLWTLTWLRLGAAYRRWKRSLAKPRGILVSVVFALLFVPSIGMAIASPFFAPPSGLLTEPIERFGPIVFLGLTVLSLATSTGDTALYFSPVEVDFLFAGPYHRRQLIGYKLIIVLLSSTFSSVFFGLMSTAVSPRFVSACVGSLLTLLFFQLSQMVLGLGLNTLGTLSWNRSRRWALLALAGLVALAVVPSRESLIATDWKAFILSVERSPITWVILAPFRWFVNTYTAKSLDSLLQWGGLALAVDLFLTASIFALDAGYLEAAAVASSRALARRRKAMGGGGTVNFTSRRVGYLSFRPPNPVWWGGIGPNLWRQTISALGDPSKLFILSVAIGGSCWFISSTLPRGESTREALFPIGLVLAVGISFLLSVLLSYDFRGDIDVIETLKTLPIKPSRLALGQVLTPAILASVIQACACVGLFAGSGGLPGNGIVVGFSLALLLPANLFYYSVENLLFLWYPTRVLPGQFDGMAVVRQLLMLLAKGIANGLAAALVTAFGVGVYFAFGRRLELALGLAWIMLAGLALGLMPLIGQAFVNFDVSQDVPE